MFGKGVNGAPSSAALHPKRHLGSLFGFLPCPKHSLHGGRVPAKPDPDDLPEPLCLPEPDDAFCIVFCALFCPGVCD